MDHRKAGRASGRRGRARAALLVLAVGLLAFAHLGGGCPPVRSSSEINSEIQRKEKRLKEVEDELLFYDGHSDEEQAHWNILTPEYRRHHIQLLRTESDDLRFDLQVLDDELLDAHDRAAQRVADQSRDAATGTTGVDPHIER